VTLPQHPTACKPLAEPAESPKRARLSLSADKLAIVKHRIVTAGGVPPPEPTPAPAKNKDGWITPGAIRVLSELRRAFPRVFREPPVPLAIGTGRAVVELLADDFAAVDIRRALTIWTSQSSYLSALAAGGPRFDLFGEPAGEVSAEHQRLAAARLASRRKTKVRRR
jgi:hypothetical protein